MIKKRWFVLIFSCFILGIVFGGKDSGRIYAMGNIDSRDGRIKEAMEDSDPQQYEMNIILSNLGIKFWMGPSYASDEEENSVDEPLGKYSPEELQKYTDRDLEVKIDYGYGCLWEGKNKERFIQSVRIYEDGKLQSCSYYAWIAGFVDNGGTRLRYPRVTR